MLDDDFIVDPRVRASHGSQLSVREPAHVPMSFAGNLDNLGKVLQPTDRDPFAEHAAACGQPPGVLFEPHLGLSVSPQTLRGVAFSRLQTLLNGQAIKTSAGGAWGDWRMDTNLWLYLAPPEYTAGMRVDAGQYRALSHRPVLAHGFDQPQLTRMTNFTPLAFDNTTLIPCTVPTGRGEDFTFATWLRYLYPDSLCLHWPTMLGHQRADGATESPHAQVYVPWLSRMAGEYALSRIEDAEAAGPQARMASLVALFRDLAAADNQRRQTVLREFLGMLRAQIVQQAQTALTKLSAAPEFWVRDAREWITENGRALTSDQAPRMREWPADLDATGCADAFARGLEGYADQLHVWPEFWEARSGRLEQALKL